MLASLRNQLRQASLGSEEQIDALLDELRSRLAAATGTDDRATAASTAAASLTSFIGTLQTRQVERALGAATLTVWKRADAYLDGFYTERQGKRS